MPFKSAKQERFMWAEHPDIARRWEDKYGSFRSGHPVPKPKPTMKRKKRKK